MCRVELTIFLGTAPAKGVRVDLASEDFSERASLGKCDENGTVVGAARAWGDARVQLMLPRRMLRHPDPIELLPGGSVKAELRYDLASLALTLPADTTFPEKGYLELAFEPLGASPSPRPVRHYLWNNKTSPGDDLFEQTGPGQVLVKALMAGTYRLTVTLTDRDAESFQIEGEDGRKQWFQIPYFEATREVILRPGAQAEVSFR